VIAVDTNLLIYSHREESEFHEAAKDLIDSLRRQSAPWAIPWPCLHEFLAIVTHPRIYRPPTPLAIAIDQVAAWLECPTLVRLAENESYWDVLRDALSAGRVAGPHVHDARIAALCLAHGARELWTHDRDFGRFPGLVVRNPLV